METKKSITLGCIILLAAILVGGCAQQTAQEEKYCKTDADCACGKHINTGECFYGNNAYVNKMQQCPDFCSGIAGNLAVRCVNNECVQQQR